MKVVILVSGILLILLVTCILWAVVDIGARQDGEYHRCDLKVTYHYKAKEDCDYCEWEDEDKEVLIIDAYRVQSPPPEALKKETFYVEISNATILETKGGIIWAD